MADTPPDTGMGPDIPTTASRSTRRTRRLAIIGALALVLVAGAVLVGVKSTGARSGTLNTNGMTLVDSTMSCTTYWDQGGYTHPSVSFSWTPVNGGQTMANGGSRDAQFSIFDGTTVWYAAASIPQTGYSDSDTYVKNFSPFTAKLTKTMWVGSRSGRTMTITWGGKDYWDIQGLHKGIDTKYSEIWCAGI